MKLKLMSIVTICLILLCACGNGSGQEQSVQSNTNQTSVDTNADTEQGNSPEEGTDSKTTTDRFMNDGILEYEDDSMAVKYRNSYLYDYRNDKYVVVCYDVTNKTSDVIPSWNLGYLSVFQHGVELENRTFFSNLDIGFDVNDTHTNVLPNSDITVAIGYKLKNDSNDLKALLFDNHETIGYVDQTDIDMSTLEIITDEKTEESDKSENEDTNSEKTGVVFQTGETLSIKDGDNEIEMLCKSVDFESEVYGSSTNMFASYFPDKEDETYVVMKTNIKNTGGNNVSYSIFDDIGIIFSEKYNYGLQQLDVPNSAMSKYWTIEPLKEQEVYFVQSIPDELTTAPFVITLKVNDDTYTYYGNRTITDVLDEGNESSVSGNSELIEEATTE